MWRRRRDSNPRDDSSPTPLAGERLRPLGHVSADAYTVTLCLFTRGFLKKLQLVCIALRWGHLWQIREIRYASVFYDDLCAWPIAYSKPKWQFWSCSGLSSELFYDTIALFNRVYCPKGRALWKMLNGKAWALAKRARPAGSFCWMGRQAVEKLFLPAHCKTE